MSDLARIEVELDMLRDSEDFAPELACQLIVDIDTAIHRAKELKAALVQSLIAKMPRAGVRELVIGEWRHCITDKKKTRCLDLVATMRALLEANGGDIDGACAALSSGAFKYGEARKMLPPEVYARLFETVTELDLEKKPVKQLTAINDRFIAR
jgi:hypothetical protein